MYEIEITNRQKCLPIDSTRIEAIASRCLSEEQVATATISIVFVDDTEIHRINREYLQHDYPTDVISFLLAQRGGQAGEDTPAETEPRGRGKHLDGEIFVSTDTAISSAPLFHWSPAEELVLYVVHGLLHLIGYDDLSPHERMFMRRREREMLAIWGITKRDDAMDDDPHEHYDGEPAPLPHEGES